MSSIGVQVVLDLDPLEILGQLLAAMLVTHPAGGEPLARLLFDALRVERGLVDLEAEQQELSRVELL